YKDNEGNTLLSTFDKGILVVPDLKIPDVINSFRDDPVTALYAANEQGLFLGSTQGNLMSYTNGTFKTINTKGTRPIDGIYGDLKSKLIVFDDGDIQAYNKQSGETIKITDFSLKDAVFVSENKFYIGTNKGIIKCEWNGKNKFTADRLPGITLRIYSLGFSPHDQLLYAATSDGLLAIDSLGTTEKITYNNQDIFALDLCYSNNKLYASTSKNGILQVENKLVTHCILPMVSGTPEALNKIMIHQNNFIARSSNGFFQFNTNGTLLTSFHTIFGFSAHRVIDFTIHENQLWVSHTGGVQQINPGYKQLNQPAPLIRLNEVRVNDETIPASAQNNFNSNQRKIQFELSSPTLRNHETMRYYYRLLGYDPAWNINNYVSNKIIYNALAPGNYTLQVKAENQGIFSEPVFYSFSIAHPFYIRWWFIASAIALFLLLVFIIYRWQLNIQRRKSQQINELNASKLKAIQSQMNPHFIFNSLNSIQDLILKGDVENSYSYITTFSNMVRRTLSYSDKDFIDFEQEIKLLELYLSLEKLRFKKDFSFTIATNNISDIQIPPMLIQPFIENALVHGLLHKEKEKKLFISFELKEFLICTVTDNGIGRENARMIKQRQGTEHESFSGKAIQKRFEILSNVFEEQFGYSYEDLYENNKACGTRVRVIIPVKHKF
ncbi:MAG: histidine kinase, partial [Bacteroidia bacterium]|nr:histidine kinase [Bacteroidia bacterium]